MEPLWTSEAAVAATGGTTRTAWSATGVSIDTRTIRPGDLFVALQAARDGHEFVAQALAAGAAAALVSHVPDNLAPDAPLLIVPDVLRALEALGRAARARTGARIAAITGSVGKTSTKDMLRTALARQGRTHAAEASYNNHWGVPLTLARMPADTEYAVFEIGMNHPGEIAPLSRMVRPHVVMVTTVGAAHLEAFDSIDGIAHEKGSICEGLEPGGTAVLNGDLSNTPILLEHARGAGAHAITFGTSPANHHRLSDIRVRDGATVGQGRAWRTPFLLKVSTEGKHFAVNALGVVAVAHALGADRAKALCALAAWSPPAGRGTREALILKGGHDGETLDLIDDAFNANPSSLGAALAVLSLSQPENGLGRVGRGRRIAILGDMLELGPRELEMHAAMSEDPGMAAVSTVHCVGTRMKALYDALPEPRRGRWVATPEELVPLLPRLIDAGDVVLVKGSKGSRVSVVVDAIRKLGQRAPLTDQEG
jgi:UDP-N-acetylmuramoyl-tripeptide--D-alanyl-D-alanine ligase